MLTAAELAEQVSGTPARYSPYGVYLSGGDPGRLAPVRDGQALVQDEGSQLVARALTLAPVDGDGGRWLDLCAGPGGKTALLAALGFQAGARVTAVEPNARRAELVEEKTRGLEVEVLRVDGRDPGVRIRLRPGARRRAVHRPGRAATPARGPLAPSDHRRAGAGQAAARTAGVGDPADPARRCGAVRDVLTASGRDRWCGRRRATPPR